MPFYQAYTYGMLKEFFRQMCQGKKGGGTTPSFGMVTYFLIGMVCQVGIKGSVNFQIVRKSFDMCNSGGMLSPHERKCQFLAFILS